MLVRFCSVTPVSSGVAPAALASDGSAGGQMSGGTGSPACAVSPRVAAAASAAWGSAGGTAMSATTGDTAGIRACRSGTGGTGGPGPLARAAGTETSAATRGAGRSAVLGWHRYIRRDHVVELSHYVLLLFEYLKSLGYPLFGGTNPKT